MRGGVGGAYRNNKQQPQQPTSWSDLPSWKHLEAQRPFFRSILQHQSTGDLFVRLELHQISTDQPPGRVEQLTIVFG